MLDWITTLPGLLITCGVVLLLVAAVLFVLGNKKGKAPNNVAINTGVTNQPLVNNEITTVEPTPVVNNTVNTEVTNVTEPVAEATTEFNFSLPEVTPVEEIKIEEPEVIGQVSNEPTVDNIVEPVVEKAVNTIPTIDIPTMEPIKEDNKEEL